MRRKDCGKGIREGEREKTDGCTESEEGKESGRRGIDCGKGIREGEEGEQLFV